MTKEEKQRRKHLRCEKRRKKRSIHSDRIRRYMDDADLTFSEARSQSRWGFFYQNGQQVQVCDWQGTCPYPCNGDC